MELLFPEEGDWKESWSVGRQFLVIQVKLLWGLVMRPFNAG